MDIRGRHNVIPVVRRARATETGVEMVLELDGPSESLGDSIQSLRERGVEVELVEG